MRVWECDRHFSAIVGPGGSQHALQLACSVLNLSHTIIEHFLSEMEDNPIVMVSWSWCAHRSALRDDDLSWRMSRISFTG